MGRRPRDIKLHRPVMLVTGYLSKPHNSRRAPGGTAFPSRIPSKNLPESRFTAFQKAFKFIDSNSYVINLGSAPGIWAKAISRLLRYPRSNFSLPVNRIPPKKMVVPLHRRRFGFLCSIDLIPMIKGIGTHFIQGDFRSITVQKEIELMEDCKGLSLADVIVADLNPTPSGIHDADHCLSVKNSLEAFDFCHRNLRYGGSFMLRFIRGRHDSQLFIEAEALFGHVSVVRTKISPSDVVHTADRDFTETWLMCRLKRNHRQ